VTARRAVLAAFVRLSRPKFLLESLITVIMGCTVSVYSGHPWRFGPWLTVQLFVTATHLMTHYCNEYFDLEADRAHTGANTWTGGSRVLVEGRLRPRVSLSAAFVLLFGILALVMAMPSAIERYAALVVLALAWFYTAPPVRLNYHAFGEVTTSGVLTLCCPALAVLGQAGTVPALLFALGVPLFLVMGARMIVMNFCDRDSDLAVGKRTLPNLLGPRRAALLFTAAQIIAYTGVLAMTVLGVLPAPAGIAVLLTAFLAYPVSRKVLRTPPSAADLLGAARIALLATVHAASTCFAATLGMLVAVVWWAPADGLPPSSVLACAALFLGYTVLFALAQWQDARDRALGLPGSNPADFNPAV
jgi:1,4-dihydroxy-2-naphthoate octaprenyltransferase